MRPFGYCFSRDVMGRIFDGDTAMSLWADHPEIHSSLCVCVFDDWVAFSGDWVQVRWHVCVILPRHYLEQQEAHRYVPHTWEKVTEKNGEQRQIASPSHYRSLLPLYVSQPATLEGSCELWALIQAENFDCRINLAREFVPLINTILCFTSSGGIENNRRRLFVALFVSLFCGYLMLRADYLENRGVLIFKVIVFLFLNLSEETFNLFWACRLEDNEKYCYCTPSRSWGSSVNSTLLRPSPLFFIYIHQYLRHRKIVMLIKDAVFTKQNNTYIIHMTVFKVFLQWSCSEDQIRTHYGCIDFLFTSLFCFCMDSHLFNQLL